MTWRFGYLLDDVYRSYAHVATDGNTAACGKELRGHVVNAVVTCQACRTALGDLREASMALVDLEGVTHHAVAALWVIASPTPVKTQHRRVRCLGFPPHDWTKAPEGATVSCLACLGSESA